MQSFFAQFCGMPLSETTKVLEMLCESSDKGFAFRSAALQLVVSQLDSFCSEASKQQDLFIQKRNESQRNIEKRTREVSYHVGRLEIIRKLLAEAEKHLASSQKKLQKLRDAEQDYCKKQRDFTAKAEEYRKYRDFYKGELDKSRSVIKQLSSKLKEYSSVSCLSQEEVLLFLQELDIPKAMRESFKNNQIGGKALDLVSDRNLRDLGMNDINQRKALLHAICNVRVHGCIHVAPPHGASGDALAAWWNADEVWKWLEEQSCSFPCLKGLTGRTLIHLSAEDISQFGLPMGTALELKAKCKSLKQSFFSFAHQQG